MSDLLVASKAFALEAEEVYDEVPEGLPRIQLTQPPPRGAAASGPRGRHRGG